MSMDENISRLVDMGIETDIAKKALEETGNQLDAAINSIYSKNDPDPPNYNEAVQAKYNEANNFQHGNDSRNVELGSHMSAPIEIDDDLKNTLSKYKSYERAPIQLDDSDDNHESKMDYANLDSSSGEGTGGNTMGWSSENVEDIYAGEYNMLEDVPREKRLPNAPGVLIPLGTDTFEGYMAPVLMIFAQIPSLRDIILKHEFFNYGFSANWWKGQPCLPDSLALQEIQRLVAFLSYDSERAYATIKLLSDAISEIVGEGYESVFEFVSFLYKQLTDILSTTNCDFEKPLSKLFETKILSLTSEHQESHQCFTIEPSYFHSTVYGIMHRLFWGRDFSNIEKNRMIRPSDILTFVFDADGQNISGGYQLSQKFYPQIYTEPHEDLIKEKIEQLKALRKKSAEITSEMLRLRSFKGKKVNSMLESTINYLVRESKQKEDAKEQEKKDTNEEKVKESNENAGIAPNLSYSQAVNELTSIRDHINKTIKEDAMKLEQNSKEQQIDIFDVEKILGTEIESLEPWILVGIILNDQQFCVLSKHDYNIWRCYFFDGMNNYEYEEMPFQELQSQVRVYSKTTFERGMVLIYVRKSVFEAKSEPAKNTNLEKFIEKDNKQLETELQEYKKEHENIEQEDDMNISDKEAGEGDETQLGQDLID